MSDSTLSRVARRLVLGAVAGLAVTAAACSSSSPAEPVPTPNLSTTSAERTAGGLQHRVTLTPARPASGDTVTFRSVLVNRGTQPTRVEHVVCGLDFDRNAILADPFIHCAAYSSTTLLAPGDSVVQQDQRVVAASAGSYTIRVRHVVPPSDVYVDVPLVVGRR